MKRFLFATSFSVSILVFSLGMFAGIRLVPAFFRSIMAFFIAYAAGLVVAMIFFTTVYYSREKQRAVVKPKVQQQNQQTS